MLGIGDVIFVQLICKFVCLPGWLDAHLIVCLLVADSSYDNDRQARLLSLPASDRVLPD